MSSGVQPRMSATTCAVVVSCPCPCGTVPSVTTISPKMSSFTVATSLFPENWSSGLRIIDCPKLLRPRVECQPDADAEELAARLRIPALVLQPVVADQLERDVETARIVA